MFNIILFIEKLAFNLVRLTSDFDYVKMMHKPVYDGVGQGVSV